MKLKIARQVLLIISFVILVACVPQQAPASTTAQIIAPAFTLDNAIGDQVSLSDYAGTPVLLFFHMAVG